VQLSTQLQLATIINRENFLALAKSLWLPAFARVKAQSHLFVEKQHFETYAAASNELTSYRT